MIELLVKPKAAERKPWEMFIIGLVYASLSILIVTFVFNGDYVLSKYSGLLIVTFTTICALPFVYYLIKLEEGKDVEINEQGKLIKEHSRAVRALVWLFLGFVVAFAFWYLVLPSYTPKNFNAQIEVFCSINSPHSYNRCLEDHGIITGAATSTGVLIDIFANNVKVLIFTIVFSLALGAGAIFILAWNASVIGAAMGMFAKSNVVNLGCGLIRYMTHGIPEIAAYFVGALAGGIISVAVIRKDLQGERMWKILQDALILMIIAVAILVIAAVIEVYITPDIMNLLSSISVCK